MKIRRGVSLHWGWAGLVAVELACGPSPGPETPKAASNGTVARVDASAPVTAAPVPKAIPELAAGDLPPIESGTTVEGRVVAADESEGFQTLLVEVAIDGLAPQLARSIDAHLFARVSGLERQFPALLALGETSALTPPSDHATFQLWVRRPVPIVDAKAGAVVASRVGVEVYTAAGLRAPTPIDPAAITPQYTFEPGQHFRIEASLPAKVAAQPKVLAAYLQALGNVEPGTPAAWFWGRDSSPVATDDRWAKARVAEEWSSLMRFSSGYDSIEAALVTEQKLRAPLAPNAATVALSSLKGPELTRHEWARMLGTLAGLAPVEPLGAMVPAEFYYARARSFEAFQTLVDQVEQVVTPALRIAEHHRQHLDLSERYRLELGLPADELARVLGPSLVDSLVLTGSDPMLRQGSDLSLILAVPSVDTVLNVLAVKRAQLSQQFPLKESSWEHAGISVTSYQSNDGRVRQELAPFKRGDGKTFVLISNSKNAVQRVLDTWVGQHAAIASELDFQYMLKRDANVAEDVLVYFGDRFVAEVVGPKQRILDSRRQVAKAELAALSCGSLLFGELYGRFPNDGRELAAKKWFGTGRLKHTTGDVITFDRIAGVSSVWGTPRRLTSIIDLPAPKRVSKEEQAAYQQFADGYRGQWGERIDPIALRVKVSAERLDAHLRVLPVMNGGDYEDVLRWSGGGLTTRVPSLPALAGILAIGSGSPLRDFLSGNGRSFLGREFKLDWLGDWVELGLVDEPAVAEFALEHGDLPEPPSVPPREHRFQEEDLARLPLYLALDIKSAAGASLFLTLVREMATGASPDNITWKEFRRHGARTIMQVAVEDITVYYALDKRRLLVSLQAEVLERLLTDLDSESKHPAAAANGVGGQLAIDLAPVSGPGSLVRQSALRTVASWLLEKGVRYSPLHDSWGEVLLLGGLQGNSDANAYEEQAFRWLGMMPVSADGKPYVLTKAGIADPDRGSHHAPKWPKVPVSGGPVEQVLEAMVGARAEVAVDDEPGEIGRDRSFRAQVRLRVRGKQRENAGK